MADIDPFLLVGTVICCIMAVVNAFRYKSRGPSAYILSAGFVVLGLTMLLLRIRANQALIYASCGVLVALLIADFIARSHHMAKKDSGR